MTNETSYKQELDSRHKLLLLEMDHHFYYTLLFIQCGITRSVRYN